MILAMRWQFKNNHIISRLANVPPWRSTSDTTTNMHTLVVCKGQSTIYGSSISLITPASSNYADKIYESYMAHGDNCSRLFITRAKII